MCYVTTQIDNYLRKMDREDARQEWMETSAENDGYSRYADDGIEAVEPGECPDADYQLAIDAGVFTPAYMSAAMQHAESIADADGYSRYADA